MDIKKKIKLPKGDGRTVIANFGYLAFLQVAGYVFPLITVPYLAKTIGAEGFGKIAFAGAIISWVQTFTDWGFLFTATRDVAQNRENKAIVSAIFSNVLWARLLLCIISGLILTILVLTIPSFRNNAAVIFITYLMVPGHICFPDWFFQAIEKMKYTTIFNLLIKFIFTIAVFILVRRKEDYIYQPLLISLSYLISGVCALWLISHKWGYRIIRPNLCSIYNTIKSSFDVFINCLFPNLYNSLSVVLLGVWGGTYATGIYDGGRKFVEIYRNLHHVLSRAFFPYLSRRSEKHRQFAVINIGSAAIGSMFLFIFAPFIIHTMLGNDFTESIPVLRILSLSIICLSVSNTYGTNYLIVHHQERKLRNNIFIISILGLLTAFPLIKNYSYIGVAMVVLICRGLLGISAFGLAYRYNKYQINNKLEK